MLHQLHQHIVNTTPALLSIPLRFIPFSLKAKCAQQLLNWQFATSIQEGELDFLIGKNLKIDIPDLKQSWYFTVVDHKIVMLANAIEDVCFSANLNDLILLMAQKEDPDTLFFQRRFHISGDTELGLYIKNLMDSMEPAQMSALLKILLMRCADFISRAQVAHPEKQAMNIVKE